MPKRRMVRSARFSDSGKGIFTRASPKNPFSRPSWSTAAREPFSSAVLKADTASRLVMFSSWAAARPAQPMTSAAVAATIAPLMRKKLIVAVAAVAIAAGAGVALLTRQPPAPEVRFVTLDGQNFATSDLRGKVVLVNFWATSCVACVEEMPKMVEAWREVLAARLRDGRRGDELRPPQPGGRLHAEARPAVQGRARFGWRGGERASAT